MPVGAVRSHVGAKLLAVSATVLGLLAGPLSGIAQASPQTFVVNTAGNASDTFIDGNCDTDGATAGSQCTLRGAIQEANGNAGLDTIAFALASPYLITLTNAGLPNITSPITIDGSSLPGFNPAGSVIVRVDAASVTSYGFNLTSTAAGSTVKGLEVVRATSVGVRIAADNTTVTGNYLGTTASSLAKCVGNASCANGVGVLVLGGANNIIGGTAAGTRNVISNNNSYGIQVSGSSSNTAISGNYVGTDVTGSTKLGNGTGIYVDGAGSTNTSIGGSSSGAGNLVSGNTSTGIYVAGTSATIIGNTVGLNAAGTAALGNGGCGIQSDQGTTVIGGIASGTGNVVSANGCGMYISGGTPTIVGNLIGLNAAGTAGIGNSGTGIDDRAGGQIGGPTAASRNVVSGSDGDGIAVYGVAPILLQGNYVGTDVSGTIAINNRGAAVRIASVAGVHVDGNVLASSSYGVYATTANDLTVTNNKIGTDVTGSLDRGNGNYGVYVDNSSRVAIGASGTGNLISGNNEGVYVSGSDNSAVTGNLIGTDASGTSPLANDRGGVTIQGSTDIVVGGAGAGAGNVVGASGPGNNVPGVELGNSDDVAVQGNRIGVTATGAALANGIGVFVDGGSDHDTIGGLTTGAGNLIAGNTTTGVVVNGRNDLVRGNSIRGNGALGIDLDQNGVTPNDAGDTDTGANRRQNFPVLTTSASNASGTQVTGSLNSLPNRSYAVDFFANTACDSSGNGEGDSYLGSITVTTDGSGNAAFQTTLSVSAPSGSVVTSTATDVSLGDTSEFSACVANSGGLPAASVADTAVAENAGTMSFTVSLSAAPVFTPVLVDYSTADGTATAPGDYTATSGTVTFNAGETTKQITVPIVNDATDEPDETLTVTLANPRNATIMPGQATATGTIQDDDPTPTLSIANAPSVAEPDTGSVDQTFTVTLSSPSSQQVTVIARTVAGTATEGSDYDGNAAQLVFAPGVTSQQFVVAVLGDTTDESNEQYSVQLQTPVNATIASGSGNGTILDNDPPPTVNITDVTQVEGNKSKTKFTFTVSMTAASARTVKVVASTADGTATAPADYTAVTSKSVAFAPGVTSRTFVVTVIGDTVVEPDETFFVNLTSPSNATIGDGQGQGTILNDD